jgi:hypothetical protein
MIKADLTFDAATTYHFVLSELMVELVKSGALRRTQVLKILLRAQGVIEHYPRDEDETEQQHHLRLELGRRAISSLLDATVSRIGAQPDIALMRRRRKRVAGAYRRRFGSKRRPRPPV